MALIGGSRSALGTDRVAQNADAAVDLDLDEIARFLIDADEAVGRRLARKHPSDMVEKRWDHLAGPEQPDQKECRQSRRDKDRAGHPRCLKRQPPSDPPALGQLQDAGTSSTVCASARLSSCCPPPAADGSKPPPPKKPRCG